MNKPYNKNKIGKFLGWGGEHFVYEYDKDKVIKFSLYIWLSAKKAVQKKKKDYEIGEKYFKEYLLPTEILIWQDGKRAVEIQPKIKCRFLRKIDLKDEKVEKQFDDIMEQHHKMVGDLGVSMDFIGREGLFKFGQQDELSNILITTEKRLVLVDFTLLELRPRIQELPLWLIIQWAKRKQMRVLLNFNK